MLSAKWFVVRLLVLDILYHVWSWLPARLGCHLSWSENRCHCKSVTRWQSTNHRGNHYRLLDYTCLNHVSLTVSFMLLLAELLPLLTTYFCWWWGWYAYWYHTECSLQGDILCLTKALDCNIYLNVILALIYYYQKLEIYYVVRTCEIDWVSTENNSRYIWSIRPSKLNFMILSTIIKKIVIR